jgi:hypothetical protein
MASASERNRRALEGLKRERRISEARQREREAKAVLRNKAASRHQKYRAKQKIKQATNDIATASVVAQASLWSAYRRTFSPATRSAYNAGLWVSGFGSMGDSRQRNRRGGFVATEQQREDRAELEKYIHRKSLESLNSKTGRVYDTNDDFWNLWREQYSDTFL